MEPHIPAQNTDNAGSPLAVTAPASPAKNQSLIIGAVVILALVLGGAFFMMKDNGMVADPIGATSEAATASDESWLPQSSASDDAAAIEAELQATNMNAFESEINADTEATVQGL